MSEIPQKERFGPRIGLLARNEETGQLQTFPWLGTPDGAGRVVDGSTGVPRHSVTPSVNGKLCGCVRVDSGSGTPEMFRLLVNPRNDIESAVMLADFMPGVEAFFLDDDAEIRIPGSEEWGSISRVNLLCMARGATLAGGIASSSSVRNANGQLADEVGKVSGHAPTAPQLLAENVVVPLDFPVGANVRSVVFSVGQRTATQLYITIRGISHVG